MKPAEIRVGVTYRGDLPWTKPRHVLSIEASEWAAGGFQVRWTHDKSKDYFTSIDRFARWAVEEVRDGG